METAHCVFCFEGATGENVAGHPICPAHGGPGVARVAVVEQIAAPPASVLPRQNGALITSSDFIHAFRTTTAAPIAAGGVAGGAVAGLVLVVAHLLGVH